MRARKRICCSRWSRRSTTESTTRRAPRWPKSSRRWRKRARSKGSHDPNGLYSGHGADRSEEHTSELQSLMRISYAVFCLKKKKTEKTHKKRIKKTRSHDE